MTLHALDVLGDAITATREYRPEGMGQWLWVALAALLVGSPGISLPTGGGGTGTGGTGTGTQELPPEARSELPGQIPQEVLGAVVAVVAVIWILFAVLGALLEFPFFVWLRDGEVDTFAEMRAHLGQALGLAAFRILLGAIGVGLVAALLVATVGTGGTPFEYLVAAGSLEAAFMPRRPHPWDAVAGVHLVRRAGGTVTALDGEPWTPERTGLVVSNGERHEAVREVALRGADRDD